MSAEDIEAVLPHYTEGPIVKGFGRGSTELGFPTANFSEEVRDWAGAQQQDPNTCFSWLQLYECIAIHPKLESLDACNKLLLCYPQLYTLVCR